MIVHATVRFILTELLNLRQMDQCTWGFCCTIMIHQQNKWKTLNNVITSHIIFMT
jgi:hypothetical protein